jgi:hypothetical protein
MVRSLDRVATGMLVATDAGIVIAFEGAMARLD